MGRLQAVITQNVDNLHQEAGSRHVIEFHGNARRFVCLRCGRSFDPKTLDFGQLPLYCPVKASSNPISSFSAKRFPWPPTKPPSNWPKLRPHAGHRHLRRSHARQLPPLHRQNHGATIVEINPETTELTRRLTDYYFDDSASQVLSEAVALTLPP